MNKLKSAYLNMKMTTLTVIIFAVVSAVVTACLNVIPVFRDTSLSDIAVVFDAWIPLALIVILKCEKWWEASLKCFLYFLISQPLIYLLEVPFVSDGFGIFRYYPYWAGITVLTLPGAAIAFLLKKKNYLSVAVLSVANVYFAYMTVYHFRTALNNFPRHILSSVFCLFMAFLLTFLIFKDKVKRIVCVAVIVAAVIISVFLTVPNRNTAIILPEGEWTVTVENREIAEASVEDGKVLIKGEKNGSTYLYVDGKDGERIEYYVTVGGGSIIINEFE